jgi:lysine 6-dehydrogenase
MRFLVIGAGKQGCACAFDLLQQPATQAVVLLDKRVDHVSEFLDPYRSGGRLELLRLELADKDAVRAAMRSVDCVLSAAPFYLNYDLAELALEEGIHFADLGGNTDVVFRQKRLHGEAAKRGVKIIPDCGVAPGMVNILAGEGVRRLDRTDSVKIYVGGLPQHPEPPLNYMVVYSLEGALDYYTTPSWVLRGGKRVQVEALSELEALEFPPPLGTLEAFHTGGGISTMPFSYEGKIATMEYKTLRYPGHVAIMKPIRDLGLIADQPIEVNGVKVRPRDVFIAATAPALEKPRAPDLIALRVEVRGTKNGRSAGTRWQMVDLYDAQHHVTSMMRTTGYSLAITGIMQVDGRIGNGGVFVPDECVPCRPYVDELAKRGIVVEESPL